MSRQKEKPVHLDPFKGHGNPSGVTLGKPHKPERNTPSWTPQPARHEGGKRGTSFLNPGGYGAQEHKPEPVRFGNHWADKPTFADDQPTRKRVPNKAVSGGLPTTIEGRKDSK